MSDELLVAADGATGAGATFSVGGDFAFLKAQHQSLALRYAIREFPGTGNYDAIDVPRAEAQHE